MSTPPHAPRVLLVDDDPAVRKALARYLVGLGCQVVATPGAQEARAILAQNGCDMVIVDLDLEGNARAGLTLLECIRGAFPELQRVVFSARLTPAAAAEALRLGAHEVVAKPELGRLAPLVEALVAKAS